MGDGIKRRHRRWHVGVKAVLEKTGKSFYITNDVASRKIFDEGYTALLTN
jgi:hypothetical protein